MAQTQSVPAAAGPVTWHALTPEEALAQQAVDAAAGLTGAEVERRRATHGPNRFAEAEKEPRWLSLSLSLSFLFPFLR